MSDQAAGERVGRAAGAASGETADMAAYERSGHMKKRVVVVCDNTMGIPGGEIDDGLAILYLLGRPDDVEIEAICTTHGNDTTANTFRATCELIGDLGLSGQVPVLRGADAGLGGDSEGGPEGDLEGAGLSDAAQFLVDAPCGLSLLSLGATTDLAAAERFAPGTLARYDEVCAMGGVTRTLIVGGKIMDELNLSVDAGATYTVLSAARTVARPNAGAPSVSGPRTSANILIADAHDCLPATFGMREFFDRLGRPGMPGAEMLDRLCRPWMEHAARAWNVEGFVGWDVLAAVAVAQPELVTLRSYDVLLNERMLRVGLLEGASAADVPPELVAPIHLVSIPDPVRLIEEVYRAWERALARLF